MRRRDDAGLSLTETMVSLVITSVLLAALASLTLTTLRTNGHLQGQLDDITDAQLVGEVVSRTIRVATVPPGEPSAIVTATPEQLTFYALVQRDGAVGVVLPTLVSYTWDAAQSCLRQSLTPARTLASPATSGSVYAWDTGTASSCIGRTDTPPSSALPWFLYYTSATSGSPLAISDAGLSLTDRQSVRSIRVTVPISGSRTLRSSTATGVTVDVQVLLANVSLAAGDQA